MNALWFFIRKLADYRRELFIGIFLSLTLTLSSIALLTLSGWFISAAAFAGLTAITAAHFNYFMPAAMIRFLALIRILSRYADRVVNHDYTFKILTQLRTWFYQQLIPLAPARLLMHRSGDLLNRIINDIDTLDNLYLNVLSPILISLITLIFITLFTAHFTLLLSMRMLTFFIVTLLFISIITHQHSKIIGKNIQESIALLRINTVDFLQGFIDSLLFIKKENRLSLITKAHDQLMKAQKRLAILKGFTQSAIQLSSGCCVFLILLIGIPLVEKKIINGAELAMIVFLIIATFEQLLSLPLAFLSLGKTQSAAVRLLEIVDHPPAVIFPEKSANNNVIQHHIVLNALSFSYPHQATNVLHNINLTISAGTHLGITGPSGSGKTTLAYLIARIWDPSSGFISIGDIDLKDFSENDCRANISLVTQHVHIFNASVRDNLTLMQTNYSDKNCYHVLEKLELAELVRNLPEGLDTLMGEFGKNFSGGQIRRIAIARALLHNSPIIILDEPSTGLENELMQRIWQNCEVDFENKTVIVITHDEKLLAMMDQHLLLKPLH